MDIERIRMFITVAESLNFTKAAEQLYISQPTLSRHIADLENQLHVDLFERTTRKVRLTAPGKLFLSEARQIIRRYDALMRRTEQLGAGVTGSLRVGYLELFTQNILPTAIRSFREKFPLVDLDLQESTLKSVQASLLDGTIDLGFVVSHDKPVRLPGLCYRRILAGQIDLIVSDCHPCANYRVVSPKILENEKILMFNPGETPELRENISRICLEYNFMPNFVTGDYTPGAIFLLVQAGMGVSILSSLICSVLRTEQRFRTLKLEGVDLTTRLELAWREDNSNPCIQNFLNEVEEAAHPGSSFV